MQALCRAGWPLMRTVVEPGAHGVVVTGMHGWDVRTPLAAAVAAATWGLLNVLHMPKGMMLVSGTWSMTDAAGWAGACTMLTGSTVSGEGVVPKEHWHMAPLTTRGGTRSLREIVAPAA